MTHSHTLTRTVMRPAVVAAMFVLSAAGCATSRAVESMSAAARSQPGAASAAGTGPSDSPTIGQSLGGRMLVRKAGMQLEVDNPVGISTRVGEVVSKLGGFVERSRESSGGGVQMTVRVPEPALEEAMESVAQLGRVVKRDISADDVTERVVDLTARAGTLRAIRDRLRSLLERAGSISEIITVEQELARVQAELDSIERRLEYLRGSASLAELSVEAKRKVILGPIGALFVGTGRLLSKLFVIR